MDMVKTLVEQSRNVITIMKDLKKIALVKGEKRAKLIERFTANQHSFNVYTYASEEARHSNEVNIFKEKLNEFNSQFDVARFEYEGDVDGNRVDVLYNEVLEAYNEMVTALGYEMEVVNIKRF